MRGGGLSFFLSFSLSLFLSLSLSLSLSFSLSLFLSLFISLYLFLSKEKGKPPGAKREKGKRQPTHFCPELTRHTHRAHARTTRNDFPVELSPQPPMHVLKRYELLSVGAFVFCGR